MTVIGRATKVVLRSGAKPGDHIFVSGSLGDSKQGLLLYKKGRGLGESAATDTFLRAFLDPKPQTALGIELARRQTASAMIDCSDGLSVDLNNICQASGVGAEIDPLRIPLSRALKAFRKDALSLALHGGEDFQLIFTVRPSALPRLEPLRKKFRLTDIGRMVAEKGHLDRGRPRPPQSARDQGLRALQVSPRRDRRDRQDSQPQASACVNFPPFPKGGFWGDLP